MTDPRLKSWRRLNTARQLIVMCLVTAYTAGPAAAALAIGVDHTPIPADYRVGVRIVAALLAAVLLLGSLWDWSRLFEVTARRDQARDAIDNAPTTEYRIPLDVV